MGTLSVRNVDDELLARLKRRAEEPVENWDELAASFRKLVAGRKHTPAEVLLRESRDER